MKPKSGILGAIVITLIFSLAMGAVGVNALLNTNNAPLIASAAPTAAATGSNAVQGISTVQPGSSSRSLSLVAFFQNIEKLAFGGLIAAQGGAVGLPR